MSVLLADIGEIHFSGGVGKPTSILAMVAA